MELQNNIKTPQNIILENRKKLTISGVTDISNFDENTISAITTLGCLTVKGSQLKINKLSVETGDVIIEGNISSMVYNGSKKAKSKNIWAQIIK